MKIHIIAAWVRGQKEPQILEAWDDLAFEKNPKGFEDDLEYRKKGFAHDSQVRAGILDVPDDSLRKMFEPVEEPPKK